MLHIKIFVGLFLLLQAGQADAVQRVFKVVLVRTAETNGSNPSTATGAVFKQAIDNANKIWAAAEVKFEFDPVSDVTPIVKDTLLHHDFMLMPGQNLNQPKNQEPQVNGSVHNQAKNNYVRKNYPGKIVVFSGAGDQLEYNDTLKKWEIKPRTYAYSNMIDLFVQWFGGDAAGNTFAHEVGHYLHLGHTHGWLPKDKAEFNSLVSDGITQWGYTGNNIASMFDGDVGSVKDTPADPGPDLWKAVTGDPCSAGNEISLNVPVGPTNYVVKFNTDRRNVMSYFKECAFADGHHISGQQVAVAKESFEYANRQYLVIQNPGILIPQWSTDVEAVSWAPGRLDLFVTGTDLKTLHKAYDPTTGWVPTLKYGAEQWDNMGGKIIGKPAAVSWGANRLDVFVRGLDNKIYHKAWDKTAWYPGGGVSDWENLGGTMAGSPVAVSWAKDRLDIFARGYDGHLWHKWWSPQSGWGPSATNWEDLGGKLFSDPAVTSWGAGRLDIVMRGSDGAVYHKAFAGNQWYPSLTEWGSLGGQIIGKPAISSWGANRLDIVVRGMDNQVYLKSWGGSSWYPSATGWSALGGSVISNPNIVSWGPGRLDIVAVGTDTQLYLKSYQEGTGWYPSLSGWSNIGGWVLAGNTPEIVAWKSGRLDIFIRNSNFQFQHKAYDSASGWYPSLSGWEDLGKYIE